MTQDKNRNAEIDMGTFKYDVNKGETVGPGDKAGMIFDDGFRKEYVEKYMEESVVHQNVFDEDKIKTLCEFMFRSTGSWRVSKTGNLFFSGNFRQLVQDYIKPWTKDVLQDTSWDWDKVYTVGGNYFHTPHQYGIHTDMPAPDDHWDSDLVTYKSMLIPLYINPGKSKCKMVYYDQRVVDSGCTLDYGPFSSTTHYNSYTDYSQIKNVYTLDGPTTIDREKTKMSHDDFLLYELNKAPSTIERYHGLSVEHSYDWTPGDLHVFDTAQIHSSTLGDKPRFKTKAGLRITFMAKRDYANYP